MKKIFTLILIIVLCLSVICCVIACNDGSGDGNPNNPELPSTDTPKNPTSPEAPTTPTEPNPEDAVIPVATFREETIDGIRYIYYGSMVQDAAPKEISVVLQNLVADNQISANDDGSYTYGNVNYISVLGTEQNEGRKLSNGMTIERDKLYFFIEQTIRWQVLDSDGENALLIADSILGEHCFNSADSYNALGYLVGTPHLSIDYAHSELRTYVTTTLFNSIFSEAEKKSIVSKNVNNVPGDSAYILNSGDLTLNFKDPMFILSHREVKEYLEIDEEENRVYTVAPKDYQLALGFNATYNGLSYYSAWWTRSNGNGTNLGYTVSSFGQIGKSAECSVNLNYTSGVRPAMWLKIA